MKRTLWFAALAVFLLTLSTAAYPAGKAGAEGELYELLARLEGRAAELKTLKTEFVQQKSLAALRNKIQIKGRIYLQKPARLAWHVDEPIRYSILITDKVIRQWDEETDRVQEMAVSKNPVMKTVLDQMTVWFTGKYSSLLNEYEVRLVSKNPIALEFTPSESNMVGKVIKSISIGIGQDERYLRWIKVLEVSGDSTTIEFRDTVLDPPPDDLDFEVKGSV